MRIFFYVHGLRGLTYYAKIKSTKKKNRKHSRIQLTIPCSKFGPIEICVFGLYTNVISRLLIGFDRMLPGRVWFTICVEGWMESGRGCARCGKGEGGSREMWKLAASLPI